MSSDDRKLHIRLLRGCFKSLALNYISDDSENVANKELQHIAQTYLRKEDQCKLPNLVQNMSQMELTDIMNHAYFKEPHSNTTCESIRLRAVEKIYSLKMGAFRRYFDVIVNIFKKILFRPTQHG